MVLKVGKQAHWQASNPGDAVERMLGLLYSHVDPLNSLVWVCLCLLSEEQRIRTPYTCGTQLAGHSSGAPHCCQSWACQIYHSLWILYFRLVRAKLMLTFWVTSCFTVRKFQLDLSIFMNWFKFWCSTWIPTRYRGRQQVYPIHILIQLSYWNCTSKSGVHWVARMLLSVSFKGYFCSSTRSVSNIVYSLTWAAYWGCRVEHFQCFWHSLLIKNASF